MTFGIELPPHELLDADTRAALLEKGRAAYRVFNGTYVPAYYDEHYNKWDSVDTVMNQVKSAIKSGWEEAAAYGAMTKADIEGRWHGLAMWDARSRWLKHHDFTQALRHAHGNDSSVFLVRKSIEDPPKVMRIASNPVNRIASPIMVKAEAANPIIKAELLPYYAMMSSSGAEHIKHTVTTWRDVDAFSWMTMERNLISRIEATLMHLMESSHVTPMVQDLIKDVAILPNGLFCAVDPGDYALKPDKEDDFVERQAELCLPDDWRWMTEAGPISLAALLDAKHAPAGATLPKLTL